MLIGSQSYSDMHICALKRKEKIGPKIQKYFKDKYDWKHMNEAAATSMIMGTAPLKIVLPFTSQCFPRLNI